MDAFGLLPIDEAELPIKEEPTLDEIDVLLDSFGFAATNGPHAERVPEPPEEEPEESVDLDRVLIDLAPPASTAVCASDLPRAWFRQFQSPRLYRLGCLLSSKRVGRHVVLAHRGSGRKEILRVTIDAQGCDGLCIDIHPSGDVELSACGERWMGAIERSGEAGLARFCELTTRLTSRLDLCGNASLSDLLSKAGFTLLDDLAH